MVTRYELVEARDPASLVDLLNAASEAIAAFGGSIIDTVLPDVVAWQALPKRTPLYAIVTYTVPKHAPHRPLATRPGRGMGLVEDSPDSEAVTEHENLLETRLTLRPAEAAQVLSMSTRSLYRLMGEGKIRTHLIGRKRMILVKDLRTWIDSL